MEVLSLLYFEIGMSQKWISGNTRLTCLPKFFVTYAIFFIDPRENKAYLKPQNIKNNNNDNNCVKQLRTDSGKLTCFFL